MYVVIELQTTAGGVVGNFVWAFANKDAAFSKFHTVLATAAVSSLPVNSCVILDNKGFQIAAQFFTHEVE